LSNIPAVTFGEKKVSGISHQQNYPVLKGRSEKEIWLATAQLQKRYSNHTKQLKIRAKKLAEFLATAEAEEVLLEQRLRDAQVTEVFQVIERKLPSSFIESQSNLKEPTRDSTNDDQFLSLQSKEKLCINPNHLQLFDSY
jgi:DNA mismatch repair ATPase MutS